jgi:hypothetical protein
MVLHGYGLDELFTQRVQRGIVKAVQEANANLSPEDCQLFFHLGEEKTVGQNSRIMLADGMIYWVGPHEDFVRPTGPFDAELPVLAFRDATDKLRALIFSHSTHTIGTTAARKTLAILLRTHSTRVGIRIGRDGLLSRGCFRFDTQSDSKRVMKPANASHKLFEMH